MLISGNVFCFSPADQWAVVEKGLKQSWLDKTLQRGWGNRAASSWPVRLSVWCSACAAHPSGKPAHLVVVHTQSHLAVRNGNPTSTHHAISQDICSFALGGLCRWCSLSVESMPAHLLQWQDTSCVFGSFHVFKLHRMLFLQVKVFEILSAEGSGSLSVV